MKQHRKFTAIVMLALLMLSFQAAAQNQSPTKHKHRRYKLIDLGTFGGLTSKPSADGPGATVLNNRGIATGDADTAMVDPNAPNCINLDCFVSHVFRWKNGKLQDLGALPGINSSNASEINARGQIAGLSSNGDIDPLTGAPELRAVLWTDDEIFDLGTLGGNTSFATGINNKGQVIGASANAVPDPFSMFGFGTQTRTFLWDNGVMRDIGTLGGPDAAPFAGPNDRGQVSGSSYTNSTPNPDTGFPTIHPFLWDNNRMIDMGTLGGRDAAAEGGNNRGQVIGQSALEGNQVFHPFLWDAGVMTDLGTLGGDNGNVSWINDAGRIVGEADLPGSEVHDAFLWKKGVMTDLGNLGQTSFAFAINSKGQVVGHSLANDDTFHAFLWEDGGPMIDLNFFVPEGSSLQQLTDAININERGEILGVGVPPGISPEDVEFGGHVFLLVPNGECGAELEARIAATQGSARRAVPTRVESNASSQSEAPPTAVVVERLRNQLRRRYHLPGGVETSSRGIR
jgi:probable HAF family extracellular repeat protein